MAAPELRPYQADAVGRAAAQIAAGHRPIVVSPTGSGKTVILAHLLALRDTTALVLVHRREILEQTVAKLYAVGIDAGIIQAGFRARPEQRVQVASIQTLHARAIRTRQMDLPVAETIVIDEAHHACSNIYQKPLAHYPNSAVIGFTATPCRGDGRGLGNIFDIIIECPSVAELTKNKYLVPAKVFAPSRPNLDGITVKAGDFVKSQLAARVDKPELIGNIVEHWLRYGRPRRTVAFTVNVSHSIHLRDEFRQAGVVAESVDGSTPVDERKAILKGFAAGSVDVLCNCLVFTEGWDCPEAECLILAHPTKSLSRHLQMVGRVLRPSPGKVDALILDHASGVFVHGFHDDEFVWTLHEDKHAENRSRSQRSEAGVPALTTCPECKGVRFGGKPCSICGWQPRPKAVPVEVAEGVLGEVLRDRTVRMNELDHYKFFCELLFIAREKGYQSGWAAHKFREKFGIWPQWRGGSPVRPDDGTRAWVRSRQIAYAKAMQKTANG